MLKKRNEEKSNTHLPISVKSQTGHAVRVDISQDGYGGQCVRVPHTDIWILPYLTSSHLNLIRVQSETATKEDKIILMQGEFSIIFSTKMSNFRICVFRQRLT